MATSYCRCTRLPNVSGRRDYISNDKRQEHLEGFYDTMSKEEWAQLGKENQAAFESARKKGFMAKNQKKAIEAREYVIHLPHDLDQKIGGQEMARMISNYIKTEYGAENCVAVHWNKSKTNYHAHIIVSERVRLKEPQRATRNMYYNADWKRCKKADAVNVVKKGDIVRCFAKGKDTRFKQKSWLERDLKPKLATLVGLEVYKDDGLHLPYQKLGKGLPADLHKRILTANNKIADWNWFVDELSRDGANMGELQWIRSHLQRTKMYWRDDVDQILKDAIDVYGTSLDDLWLTQQKQFNEIELLEKQKGTVMQNIQRLHNEKDSLDIYAKGNPLKALANRPKKANLQNEIDNQYSDLNRIQTLLEKIKAALDDTQIKISKRSPELWQYATFNQLLEMTLRQLLKVWKEYRDIKHTGYGFVSDSERYEAIRKQAQRKPNGIEHRNRGMSRSK